MKNVLITGASGWLGINLINTFLKGIDLYPETKNLMENKSINVFIPKAEHQTLFNLFGDKIRYYYGDITKKEDCKNFLSNFDPILSTLSKKFTTYGIKSLVILK